MRCLLLLLAACSALAQAPATPEFDAASVKKSETRMSREWLEGDPGQAAYHNYSVRKLILEAYNLRDYQLTGPAWINSERFDVLAKIPAGSGKPEVRLMLQKLLSQRFGLAVHHDTQEMMAYELTVAKGGLKNLRPTAGSPMPKPGPGETLIFWPREERAGISRLQSGLARNRGLMHTIAEMTAIVERRAGVPIIDKTGLTGVYDWDFDSASGAAAPAAADSAVPGASDPGPEYLTAFQQQLGLHLEKKKLPIAVLVVDKVERPSEN